MPSALVEIRRLCSEQEEVAMIEAVHDALVVAFRIPPQDRDVRLVSHEPHRFAVSPRLERPELATLVTVDCFVGRSVEAKRTLYAAVVDRFEALGVPRDHVTITLRESPAENWGIRGGQAACDVDLGFDVHV
jgi:phenylpyruvate tautomerase PptA (4-oxalocrotonate tautomerase family)